MPSPSTQAQETALSAYYHRAAFRQDATLAQKQHAFLRAYSARALISSNGDPTHGMFSPLFMFGVYLAGAVLVGRALAHRRRHRGAATLAGTLRYTAAASLLTPTEAKFHAALAEAVGPMATIQCKVRLADLLTTKRGDYASFNRVSQKHVDFLLCDRRNLRPLVAVELDDPSHDRPDRMARDAFVDAAYAQAGLPLIHVRVQNRYNTPEILRLVQPHLVSSSV